MQLLLAAVLALAPADSPKQLAETYATAIEELNQKHARSPGTTKEDELEKQLPAAARAAFEQLLKRKAADELVDALALAATAAAELDLERDFDAARARLAELDAPKAEELGRLVSRERFQIRGTGGLEPELLEHFADVCAAILGAYDDEFGFAEFSKVPGKKLRVLVHRVPQIVAPPHFAPEFRFHSQIDFPVVDAHVLRSPTPDGKFLFYGLCHELGHVVAMWGDRDDQADHHAWAHYTGVVIVEHLASDARARELLDGLDDVNWRSLAKEREAAVGVAPSTRTREGVLALLIALHDRLGPKALGAALNALDAKGDNLRINRVRYYDFKRLRAALLAGAKDERARNAIRELLP